MTGTITFQYDEVRLARWIERKVEEAGIRALVGAVLTDVGFRTGESGISSSQPDSVSFASRRPPTWMRPVTRRSATRPGSRSANRRPRCTAR